MGSRMMQALAAPGSGKLYRNVDFFSRKENLCASVSLWRINMYEARWPYYVSDIFNSLRLARPAYVIIGV